MPRYQFNKSVGACLLDQLIAAGFSPLTLVEFDATRCWITCAPEQFDAAASVVAVHDPSQCVAPIAAIPTDPILYSMDGSVPASDPGANQVLMDLSLGADKTIVYASPVGEDQFRRVANVPNLQEQVQMAVQTALAAAPKPRVDALEAWRLLAEQTIAALQTATNTLNTLLTNAASRIAALEAKVPATAQVPTLSLALNLASQPVAFSWDRTLPTAPTRPQWSQVGGTARGVNVVFSALTTTGGTLVATAGVLGGTATINIAAPPG